MQLIYKETPAILKRDIIESSKPLLRYISYLKDIAAKRDFSDNESFINLPFSEDSMSQVFNVRKLLGEEKVKQVVVIGIGGSIKGTQAVYHALPKKKAVSMTFMEDIDAPLPEIKLSPEAVVVNVVSKSGSTIETNFLKNSLLQKYPELASRVVTTSSKEPGNLGLYIPEAVGGRYSVFSTVGLFPLSLAGLDVFKLLEGAMLARKVCLENHILLNPALTSAVVQYLQVRKGKNISVSFYFHSQLGYLGEWWTQLVAESLGKSGKGVTPMTSFGTRDLHSTLQLYLDGPKDKYTEFVYAPYSLSKEVYIILGGVLKSYDSRQLPYGEFTLKSLDEYSLGYYMQCKMMEIMFLAQLLQVNAFDQPAVEDYKTYARDQLADYK
jgi:glucose-6-phosphate isomerase